MAQAADNEQAYVELKFCPSPDLIAVVRRFVSAFYEGILSQSDAASRLGLATHELLENTVKFSRDSVSSIHLGIVPIEDRVEVSIRTRNRASEKDRENAIALVTELQGVEDTFAHYQQVMRRNARRRDGSGLGLVRIAAEADMALACEVNGDELVITARTSVPGAAQLSGGLEPISSSHFAAVPSFEGQTVIVRLTGNADLGAKAAVETLLLRLHAEAVRRKAPEVVVDLTGLEFMNSSCFRNFVSWVSDVEDLPREERYRIRLVADPTMLWQRRSLHALKCFADELITIERGTG